MIVRRAIAAGIATSIGCHTFRATGIAVYLLNGGLLEYAQQMAAHESARTTKLYDRRNDQVTLDQVERIVLNSREDSHSSSVAPRVSYALISASRKTCVSPPFERQELYSRDLRHAGAMAIRLSSPQPFSGAENTSTMLAAANADTRQVRF